MYNYGVNLEVLFRTMNIKTKFSFRRKKSTSRAIWREKKSITLIIFRYR